MNDDSLDSDNLCNSRSGFPEDHKVYGLNKAYSHMHTRERGESARAINGMPYTTHSVNLQRCEHATISLTPCLQTDAALQDCAKCCAVATSCSVLEHVVCNVCLTIVLELSQSAPFTRRSDIHKAGNDLMGQGVPG